MRSAGPPVGCGHFGSFHRAFSAARWSLWALAKAAATAAVAHVPEGRPAVLAVGDTACRHRGPEAYGRRNGRGLVPVRWAFVRDATGRGRAEHFTTTDPAMTPAALVSS